MAIDDAPRTTRFVPAYALGHLGWAVPSGAVGTLVPALLATGPAGAALGDKVTGYAVLTALGAVGSIAGAVLGGALSDRTRSRFGRRRPWLAGGAVAGAGALALVGATDVFAVQVVAFVGYQVGLNAMLAALYALLPERVPAGAVGRVSAVAGAGYLVGTGLGAFAAAATVTAPGRGLAVVGAAMVVGVAALCGQRDPAPDAAPPPGAWPTVRGTLGPAADRDFVLAFAGRFLVVLGLFGAVSFQLYLLTDQVGVDLADAGAVLAVVTAVFAAAALVGTAVGGVVADRTGRRRVWAALASWLIAVALLPLAAVPGRPTLLAFAVVGGLGYGAYLASDQALMAGVLTAGGTEATQLGILGVANSAPLVAGPPLAGLVVSTLGYPALFTCCAVTAVAGGACVLAVRRVP